MTLWSKETGFWRKPGNIWNVEEGIPNIPSDAPDCWLSRPGGEYFLGMSFHSSPFNQVHGSGCIGSVAYQPSDFLLSRMQDPYNSWGVNARKNTWLGVCEHWDWLSGITVIDEAVKYTLPAVELARFAGTEWADNDFRVFHGIYSDEIRDALSAKFLEVINGITGPRYAGWPFGNRQLSDAVFVWVHHESREIHAILLASPRQFGDKHVYFNQRLYDPGRNLGAWNNKPTFWDCRRVLQFLYKSRLLLSDGFHEIALMSASSSVESAFYEVVLYLENYDADKAKSLVGAYNFRDRIKKLIPKYGFALPKDLFDRLTLAYKARNSIAHNLGAFSYDCASTHVDSFEEVVMWLYENVRT